MANLATKTAKANWPMIATLVRSIFEQPDRDTTWNQLGDVIDKLTQAGFVDIATMVLDAADGWEEGPFDAGFLCDFDGDGTSSEYVAVGTNSALVQLHEDGRGVTHAVAMERSDGAEYYSVDADESIFETGRSRYVGTLDADLLPLDGRFWIDTSFSDLDGNVVFSLIATGRYTDGVFEAIDAEIDGPCDPESTR